jgi:hypothetical protein
MEKPTFLTEEDLNAVVSYLNAVRDSGRVNMFEAPRYLRSEFGYNQENSLTLFVYWASTFDSDEEE